MSNFGRYPMQPLAVALLALLLFGPAAGALAGGYHAEVGQRHADFTLPEIRTGKPVSLSDFQAKKVLLIHFASW